MKSLEFYEYIFTWYWFELQEYLDNEIKSLVSRFQHYFNVILLLETVTHMVLHVKNSMVKLTLF